MIPLRDLLDDYYEFDERNYCLVGRRFRKRYALGDQLTIRVERANLEKKQLDFSLVEEIDSPANRPQPSKKEQKTKGKRYK